LVLIVDVREIKVGVFCATQKNSIDEIHVVCLLTGNIF